MPKEPKGGEGTECGRNAAVSGREFSSQCALSPSFPYAERMKGKARFRQRCRVRCGAVFLVLFRALAFLLTH